MGLIAVNWKPDRKQLRSFGLAGLVAFGGLGTWVFFMRTIFGVGLSPAAAQVTGIVLWSVGALCGLLSLTAPAGLRPLYVGLTLIALPIGFVVSHVILGVLFYGVFTPVALVFRLIGRDALHRRFDPAAETYWVRRKPTADVKRYFRQV